VTPGDSVGLAGRYVVLHEMREASGDAIDSVLTDRGGQYLFLVQSPDVTADYFVSVAHDDIGYFSNVLHLEGSGLDTVPTIVVFDTSYAGPEIRLRERHVVVRSEEPDGTRQVIELIVLRNDGRFTRIASDTSTPVWEGVLPPNAIQFAVGESEVGAGAIYLREDRMAVAAPLPPGEKQLLVSYLVPRVAGSMHLPVDQPTHRLTVSLEDTTASMAGGVLELRGIENVGGTRFKRYEGSDVAVGTPLNVQFDSAVLSLERLQLFFVVAVTLALAGTLTWWLRKQRSASPP